MLAKHGFSREVIQQQGRWSSDAFEAYIKEGRGVRMKTQLEVAECLTNEATGAPREVLVDEE